MSAKRRRPAKSHSDDNSSYSKYSDYEDAFESQGASSRKPRGHRRPRSPTSSSGQDRGLRDGRIVSRSRGHYRVEIRNSEGEHVEALNCSLRGRLQGLDVPVVGDCVRVRVEGEEGVLEEVLERRNSLTRVSEEDELVFQVIAANIDVLAIVLSVEPPPPRWALADRMLVLAEREGFETVIVLNKMDLLEEGSVVARDIVSVLDVYRDLGVEVFLTSATAETGLSALEEKLRGRVSVLSGHSGVGKSSLLNALYPGLNLAVGRTNPQTGKGRHTTTLARLIPLPRGGYMVDTPGFREFGLGDIPAADLGRYYPEFREIIGKCRFSDCLHRREPGCALQVALEQGEVSKLRYQNYLQILTGLVERHR